MIKKVVSFIGFVGASLAVGFVGSLLGDSRGGFDTLRQPPFAPPAILFPIVWTALYVLMGVSAFLVFNSHRNEKTGVFIFFATQLVVNMLWTFFFFRLEWRLFAFFWLVLLLVLVAIMFRKFLKINRPAAYLQMPYLVWLTFAAVLNFSVYWLNR